MEREGDYFKELAHMIVRAGKSEICRAGWKPWEELMWQLESEGRLETEFLLFWGTSVFFLLRPSNDWMSLAPIIEGIQLDSKSTDINVNLILKTTFTATSRLVFDQIWPSQIDAKIESSYHMC